MTLLLKWKERAFSINTDAIDPLTLLIRCVDEIARILGGITITVATKRAAAEMLENGARVG